MHSRLGLLIVSALLFVAFSFLRADDAATRTTLARLQATQKERPNDGTLVFYRAMMHIRLGEKKEATELLRTLKGRHLGIIPVRDVGFDAVWDDPAFEAVRKDLEQEEEHTPAAPVAFRLSDPKLIPEGIAYDVKGKRFFIGSIAQRKIVVSDEKGEARDFSQPSDDLASIVGVTVDAARAQLCAVSTNGFFHEAKTNLRNEVVRYDLKTGKLLDRFSAPDAEQLNDLAVAADGTLYATDSLGGSLFSRKKDEKTLTLLGEKGGLRGVNGIAFSDDGLLYVTLGTGIALVDTTSGEGTRLPQPDTIVTGGIDGLYWYQGDLLGIQNTTNPGRVVRIAMSDKGRNIIGLTVLQTQDHPDFAEPTTGAIAGNALYVIANSYVGHFQPDGTIKDAAELKGTAIVAVPCRR